MKRINFGFRPYIKIALFVAVIIVLSYIGGRSLAAELSPEQKEKIDSLKPTIEEIWSSQEAREKYEGLLQIVESLSALTDKDGNSLQIEPTFELVRLVLEQPQFKESWIEFAKSQDPAVQARIKKNLIQSFFAPDVHTIRQEHFKLRSEVAKLKRAGLQEELGNTEAKRKTLMIALRQAERVSHENAQKENLTLPEKAYEEFKASTIKSVEFLEAKNVTLLDFIVALQEKMQEQIKQAISQINN